MGAEGGKRAVDDLSLISTRSKIPKFANNTATANRLYAVLHSLLSRQHTKSQLQPGTSTGKWRWVGTGRCDSRILSTQLGLIRRR